MSFKPSTYQKEIFGFIKSGRGDGIVNAVAGSGKTTTLKEGARLIRGTAIFLAFNKHIAEYLNTKLEGTTMRAITIHALGRQTLVNNGFRRLDVKEQKYFWIVKDFMAQPMNMKRVEGTGQPMSKLLKLINFSRLTLTDLRDPQAVQLMCLRYNIDYEPRLVPVAAELLEQGTNMARIRGRIDFTDMLYLPYKFNLTPDRFQWAFVDECQDMSAASLDLVLKTRDMGGRQLYVGDPYQAIMAFAGADAKSYWKIKEKTGATEFPLSVCYRCPEEHIRLAQELVPAIMPKDGAPKGVVNRWDEEKLLELVSEGDLIMCRRNAPLIKHCLRLIRKQIPARVRGRDIGKELGDLAREIVGDSGGTSFDKFPAMVERYKGIQEKILDAKNAPETSYDSLNDRCESLVYCWDGFKPSNVEELAKGIESLFDDARAGVMFSSIHRAKGLEEHRTWILEYPDLGEPRPRQNAEEMQQERNLKYVALTRSMDTMTLLGAAQPEAAPAPVMEAAASTTNSAPLFT